MSTRLSRRRTLQLAATAAVAALTTACSGAGASDEPGGAPATQDAAGAALNLYAFSVAKPAFDRLAAAYAATPEGRGTTLRASYGPSAEQSRKVLAGAPADLVALSLAPDVTRLVAAGLVTPDWDAGGHGSPFGSVVALVVRAGNPRQVRDWDDLLRPGVDVVTPNPLSSGSAQWNLLAPYAVASDGGRHPAAGLDYVRRLVAGHLSTQPASAAEATETFRQGSGDVLVSYENEAIAAIRAGDAFEYVVPPGTIRIDAAVAPLATSRHAAEVASLAAFLAGPAGQAAVAEAGFRPADADVLARHAADFPTPDKLWTVADLGGWPAVTASLFDPVTGAIARAYAEATR